MVRRKRQDPNTGYDVLLVYDSPNCVAPLMVNDKFPTEDQARRLVAYLQQSENCTVYNIVVRKIRYERQGDAVVTVVEWADYVDAEPWPESEPSENYTAAVAEARTLTRDELADAFHAIDHEMDEMGEDDVIDGDAYGALAGRRLAFKHVLVGNV